MSEVITEEITKEITEEKTEENTENGTDLIIRTSGDGVLGAIVGK